MQRLEQIKQHPKFPFQDYRDDEESFLMSQLYWMELFRDAMAGADGHWEGWLEPASERDGSSIFSAVCKALQRGVIVNQYAPTPDDVSWRDGGAYYPFVAWMDMLGGGDLDPAIEHLTLNSEISDECEALCRKLLRAYVVEGWTRRAMEEEISRLDESLYGPR